VEPCPIDIYTQPKQWFQYFDKDNSGSLDKGECIEGFARTFFHIDRAAIESVVDAGINSTAEVLDMLLFLSLPRKMGFARRLSANSLVTIPSRNLLAKPESSFPLVFPVQSIFTRSQSESFQYFDKDSSHPRPQ
jgi:hypothetical protein